MDDEAYQRAHGEWMRNGTGSGLAEMQAIGLIAPLSVFLLKLTRATTTIPQLRLDGDVQSTHEWVVSFLVDFIVIIIPQLVAVICSYVTNHLIAAGVAMSVIISLIFAWSAFQYYARVDRIDIAKVFHGTTQDFVTSFRACVLLLTVVCILAVDFPAFPRRFAKTETYGTSLMDAGVGMFVISNAIVSPEARKRNRPQRVSTVLSVVPLLVLGFGRVVVLKAIGYHENPSEYGTHWNFFFTLALVRILATLIFYALGHLRRRVLPILLTSFLIMSSYQLLLSKFELNSYILGMERPTVPSTFLSNFLHHNRGGLSSCAGYLSLYLVGVVIGRTVFSEPKRSLWQILKLLSKLFGVALLMMFALPPICAYTEPVSRRLANLSYFVSVIMIANVALPLFMALDLCVAILSANCKQRRSATTSPKILDAVNRHGLAVFLLANLLTGLINISMSTIYAPASTAMSTLVIYLMSITFVASIWQRRQIKTKLW